MVGQQAGAIGHIAVWHVVDGQQRLTTLQLLIEAARRVVQRHGISVDAEALKALVHNQPSITQSPDEVFKVWPTDRDQDAYRAAMSASDGVAAGSRMGQAIVFFEAQVMEWADVEAAPAGAISRLAGLVKALREYLRIVVIDLEPSDNAQVIFETLNHRGTPLLAADLVKNLVFQIASAHQLDVQGLYDRHWKLLDNDHWRGLVPQGRRSRPRIDVFLNYWLTMKLLSEVPNDRVFPDFRDSVARGHADIAALIAEVADDAAVFTRLEQLPAGSPEGVFQHRVIRSLDAGVVTPVLLWLMRWSEAGLPVDQRRLALGVIESWLVRRALARLTSKNINQVVLELLRAMHDAGPATAGDAAEAFLVAQTADSRLWPDDATVIGSLTEANLYTSILRPRLRMLLEALEDDLRSSDKSEGQPCPRGLTVEHVMPQAWREHWPTPDDPPIVTVACSGSATSRLLPAS